MEIEIVCNIVIYMNRRIIVRGCGSVVERPLCMKDLSAEGPGFDHPLLQLFASRIFDSWEICVTFMLQQESVLYEVLLKMPEMSS